MFERKTRNVMAGLFVVGAAIVGGSAFVARAGTITPPPSPSATTAITGTQNGLPTPPVPAQGMPQRQARQPSHPARAGRCYEQRRGPAESGSGANTQAYAVRELEHVYHRLGVMLNATSTTLPSSVQGLVDTAKNLYNEALNSYNGGNYAQTNALAQTGLKTIDAVRHLAKAERGTTGTVAGLTPPPAVNTATEQQHANLELQHTYQILTTMGNSNTGNQTVANLVSQGEGLYQAALNDYNASNYAVAKDRAHAAKDLAEAAARYNFSLTGSSQNVTPAPSAPVAPLPSPSATPQG